MFESLPGFREFYPSECSRRNHLFQVWRRTAVSFGFQEYDAPLLEPLELYVEKSGAEIVDQLFNFRDKGGREVAMRPELTPSLARMAGARANSLKRPVKWYCIGENFRYEKPQKGRLRSHYQLNCDILGEAGPGADAELIALLVAVLRALGLGADDVVVRLSDRTLWMHYLAAMGLDAASAGGVLGVIDKMERQGRDETIRKLEPWLGAEASDFLIRVEALARIRDLGALRSQLSGHGGNSEAGVLLEGRLAEWEVLLASLEALGVADMVRLDLGVVRGLAYYTGFVFEVFERGEGETRGRAVAGGGRYDHLVEKLGYPALPAVGFGLGDVVLSDLLDEKGLLPAYVSMPDVYVVAGPGDARAAALRGATALREAGYRVEYALRDTGFGRQFRFAGGSGARFAVIFGEEEVRLGAAKIRDMQSGAEEVVPVGRMLEVLGERLG